MDFVKSTTGAGCLVLNGESVLLVKLNYGRAKGKWILPGGFLEENEHPSHAAIRECFEETGQKVVIQRLLAVRHRIETDDLNNIYFVFLAILESENQLVWNDGEIQEAKFWVVSEALNSDFVRPYTKEVIKKALEVKSMNIPSSDFVSDSNDEVWII